LKEVYNKLKQYNCTVKTPVHCECALIHYFRSMPESEVALVDYLGVSKLPCKACLMYIKASNKTTDHKFYTRGGHNKWYFPWALPPSEPQVVEEFLDRITHFVAHMLQGRGGARPRILSDSSTPSIGYQSVDKDDQEEEDFARAEIAKGVAQEKKRATAENQGDTSAIV
jgi:hypothetical protein